MDHPLTPWEKIAIIFVGGSIAGLTLLVVVCLVCPTCFFYRILNKSKYVIVSYLFCFHSLYSNRDGRRSKNLEAPSFGGQLMNQALLLILSKLGRGPRSRWGARSAGPA